MKFSYFCWRLLKDISRINLNEAFTYKKWRLFINKLPLEQLGRLLCNIDLK